eukprot:6173663-Pleurochrysis_carterae.AAC.2
MATSIGCAGRHTAQIVLGFMRVDARELVGVRVTKAGDRRRKETMANKETVWLAQARMGWQMFRPELSASCFKLSSHIRAVS